MRIVKCLALAALVSALACPGWAQAASNWPERPVRLITPVPPGGSPDVVARLFAEKLSERWKTSVVVENRPGADGVLGVRAVLDANDDHTLLVAPSGMLTVTPAIKSVPFDLADLQPLSTVAVDFLAVAVPTSSAIRSLQDLVAAAREKPGAMNWFASAGAPAMAFTEFLRKNQLGMVYVPYKGGPEALRDLSEDRIQVVLVPLAPVLSLASAGTVRLLAVTNPERAPNVPQVPTAIEAGHPELAFEGVLGFLASKAMAKEASAQAAADIQIVADDALVQDRLLKGGQVAKSSTPAAYKRLLGEQREHWGQLAKTQPVTKN